MDDLLELLNLILEVPATIIVVVARKTGLQDFLINVLTMCENSDHPLAMFIHANFITIRWLTECIQYYSPPLAVIFLYSATIGLFWALAYYFAYLLQWFLIEILYFGKIVYDFIDEWIRRFFTPIFCFSLDGANSPLEIFEVTIFDVFGFEINETYAFSFFSILSAFIIGNTVVGETTIEEEEDEDFEDEDFTMDATDSLITDNLGDNDDEELDTIIQTIFQSVLFSNLANLIPFGDSNSNFLIFTLYLAGTCFLALNFNGFLIHTFNMIQLFLPQGVPSFLRPLLFVIEFISYFARLFSLGIRLFANMLSGHILIAILSTFAVILLVGLNFGSFASIVLLIIITCIFFLETIISYLQAYVFGMLVTIYYGDALNLHH